MFDNPFDSFHNAVAEAKEEREQLDRLLTISTPRERLLVVVISITIVAFAVWLFFGQVAQGLALNATLAFKDVDASTTDGSTKLQVQVQSEWLKIEEARQINEGLPAVIEVTLSDGHTTKIRGKVEAINTAHVVAEGETSQTAVAPPLYKIYLTLNEEIDAADIGNRNCHVVIEIGKQSPISLFGMRRS